MESFTPKLKRLRRKRLFDIAFSAATLVLLSPLYLLIATLICLTSKGPPLFSHMRIGKGGKPFRCFKFRTMYTDMSLDNIVQSNPLLMREWQMSQKLKNDPRVTPLGAFLRKTSLDELPQFWNVLIGDLSVVGPRPVIEEEIKRHFGQKANKILSIRPGLTGIWQTSGRSNTSYARRLQLDEKYVDSYSLLLDIQLIFKTIPQMIAPKDAY